MLDNKDTYSVIGLMSGTSLDGLDIAHCIFRQKNTTWEFDIKVAQTINYPENWLEKLKQAELSNDFNEIDIEYGKYLAKCVSNFILNHSISSVDLIASHGHTLFHEPENGITVQIGNGQQIAELTQCTTVSNFRQTDVKLGGQGAPLVPIGDLLLFPEFETCVNIGGFANLSRKENGLVKAWDICPANYVLNDLCSKLNLPYDSEGKIAKSGTISLALLQELNALPFYKENPPKSLGREWVAENITPILNKHALSTEDKIATFTEHIATQIGTTIPNNSSALFTGGGTFNSFLMNRIKHHNSTAQIIIPSQLLVEFKEALIFAFLGLLRMKGEVNILASVTGAKHDHSSGDIYVVNR